MAFFLFTPPPAPPLKGEGSSDYSPFPETERVGLITPPSLSGKGAGGLG